MRSFFAAALLLGVAACGRGDTKSQAPVRIVPVTITSGAASHVFRAELARTTEEQAKGLMFRTDLTPDSAMLFAPYPAGGGDPRVASFWMKNTPSSLDILFIRADGTIARIAENTVPFSEAPVSSGEAVAAVLEVPGGRSVELGIGEGDIVRWPATAIAP